MEHRVLRIALSAIFIYTSVCAGLFLIQRSLIYHPQPGSAPIGATSIHLPVDDADLVITTRPHEGPRAVVYFGGNAEDANASLPDLMAAFPAHALYLMNYRGYGGSTGSPSEAALVADAVKLFDQVHAAHAEVVVIGRSLGSGVAVQLASQRPASRLVLVTPYDSVLNVGAQAMPFIPVRWLLRDRYESWRFAEGLQMPTTLIAAEHDEVIPRASTTALMAHLQPGVARLLTIRGTGHNNISRSPDYAIALAGTSAGASMGAPAATAAAPSKSAEHFDGPTPP